MSRTTRSQKGYHVTVDLMTTAVDGPEMDELWTEIVLALNGLAGVMVAGGSHEPMFLDVAALAKEDER